MLAAITLREFLMICIPLFLLLSGYLLCNKTLNRGYFKRILPILGTFLLAEIACWVYRLFWRGETFDPTKIAQTFANFRAAPYGWYIEMYIGLFLLIPFLNILYHGIKAPEQKRLLLIILFTISVLPSIVSVYDFSDANWWAMPSGKGETWRIIPDWWRSEQIAFIFYYLMGCYLREFPLKIKKYRYIIIIIAITIVCGLYSFWRSHNNIFVHGAWNGNASVFSATISIMIFSLLLNINYPKTGGNILKMISELCLGAYLVSWIFDEQFYRNIRQMSGVYPHRLIYMPLVVLAVFVCSFLLSAVLMLVQKFIIIVFSSTDLRKRLLYWVAVIWAGLFILSIALASSQALTG